MTMHKTPASAALPVGNCMNCEVVTQISVALAETIMVEWPIFVVQNPGLYRVYIQSAMLITCSGFTCEHFELSHFGYILWVQTHRTILAT